MFRRVIRLQFNPLAIPVPAEPCQLPFRELARADFHQFYGIGQVAFAFQMFHNLSVADRLHGDSVFGEAAFEQIPRFLDQTAMEHFVYAGINPIVQILNGTGETEETQGAGCSELGRPVRTET